MQNLLPLLGLIMLTLASGVFDAHAFVGAAGIWKNGIWDKTATLKTLLFFQAGIGSYMISVRFAQAAGIMSPELQSLFWFAVTLIGVAVISGKIWQWSNIDRVIALLVLIGIGWLMMHNGD